MTTFTVRTGNVMAKQSRQESFIKTSSGAIAPNRMIKRTLIGRCGHQEWTESVEDAWRRHMETLQKYITELLLNNQ
jgi:hypothetical protein